MHQNSVTYYVHEGVITIPSSSVINISLEATYAYPISPQDTIQFLFHSLYFQLSNSAIQTPPLETLHSHSTNPPGIIVGAILGLILFITLMYIFRLRIHSNRPDVIFTVLISPLLLPGFLLFLLVYSVASLVLYFKPPQTSSRPPPQQTSTPFPDLTLDAIATFAKKSHGLISNELKEKLNAARYDPAVDPDLISQQMWQDTHHLDGDDLIRLRGAFHM